jgi:hypothetical protein
MRQRTSKPWVACGGQWLPCGRQTSFAWRRQCLTLLAQVESQRDFSIPISTECFLLACVLFCSNRTAVYFSKSPAAANLWQPTSTTRHGACSRPSSSLSAVDGPVAAAGGNSGTSRSALLVIDGRGTNELSCPANRGTCMTVTCVSWLFFGRNGWRISTSLISIRGRGSTCVPAKAPRSLRWSNRKRLALAATPRAHQGTWRTWWQAMTYPAMAMSA